MRTNSVTGAFVVLNTTDLSSDMRSASYENKPGIYIRDLDPLSQASYENTDLLLECAPTPVAKDLGISMDSAWRPLFDFKKLDIPYYDFLYEPYQKALENPEMSYTDLGYWSKPYQLFEDERRVVSYSVPLILNDGTVYGVLGIELTLDHLIKLLPYDELSEGKNGSYVLAVSPDDSQSFDNLLISGPIYKQVAEDKTTLVKDPVYKNCYDMKFSDSAYGGSEKMHCSVQYLNLYNSNTPFSGQKWALIGTMRSSDLFAFSGKINYAILLSILLTLVTGFLGIFIISFVVSKPITSLVNSVKASRSNSPVLLGRTNIREVDELASSIEHMSEEVFDNATKFTQIIEMASVKKKKNKKTAGKSTFSSSPPSLPRSSERKT